MVRVLVDAVKKPLRSPQGSSSLLHFKRPGAAAHAEGFSDPRKTLSLAATAARRPSATGLPGELLEMGGGGCQLAPLLLGGVYLPYPA